MWSFYLGVGSLLPGVGFLLGLGAIASGLRGLSAARKDPELGGQLHGWVGIFLGTSSVLAHLVALAGLVSEGYQF